MAAVEPARDLFVQEAPSSTVIGLLSILPDYSLAQWDSLSCGSELTMLGIASSSAIDNFSTFYRSISNASLLRKLLQRPTNMDLQLQEFWLEGIVPGVVRAAGHREPQRLRNSSCRMRDAFSCGS
jgi:hypothetical protein